MRRTRVDASKTTHSFPPAMITILSAHGRPFRNGQWNHQQNSDSRENLMLHKEDSQFGVHMLQLNFSWMRPIMAKLIKELDQGTATNTQHGKLCPKQTPTRLNKPPNILRHFNLTALFYTKQLALVHSALHLKYSQYLVMAVRHRDQCYNRNEKSIIIFWSPRRKFGTFSKGD